METPDYVARNRRAWNDYAADYVAGGERRWEEHEPSWGIWGVPETDLSVLPDVTGLHVLEDGCGTAYVSAWLARRGADVVGLDNSPAQLATARRLQGEHDLLFPLIQGIAESLPFVDGSFDLVISEYGAVIWSDPYRWIPEAARVLRPGGELIFLGNSTLLMLCVFDEDGIPANTTLKRPQFDMHRFEWPGDESVEFHQSHGDRIRLLRDNGFEVIDLIEVRAPEGATTGYDFVDPRWARQWPSEEVWKARKK